MKDLIGLIGTILMILGIVIMVIGVTISAKSMITQPSSTAMLAAWCRAIFRLIGPGAVLAGTGSLAHSLTSSDPSRDVSSGIVLMVAGALLSGLTFLGWRSLRGHKS